MVAEFCQSLRQELRHGFTRLGQDLAVGDEAACLQGENEILRHVRRPFGEGLGFLAAIIGAVHLDRRQLPAGMFQLAFLRQFFRIKRAFPRLESPAADTGADRA